MKKSQLEKQVKEMQNALWAIANMQINEKTDHKGVLALCVSIAKIEVQKLENRLSKGI